MIILIDKTLHFVVSNGFWLVGFVSNTDWMIALDKRHTIFSVNLREMEIGLLTWLSIRMTVKHLRNSQIILDRKSVV